MLMFGWDFEVNAWSRFWRRNLIMICDWIVIWSIRLLWLDELNPRVRCAFGNVYEIRHPKIYLTNNNETLCFKNIYLKTIHRPFNSKWDHVRTISLLRHGRHKKTYGSLVSYVRGAIDHSNGALDCSNEALNHTSVLGRQKNKYFLWCILAVLWILFFFSARRKALRSLTGHIGNFSDT